MRRAALVAATVVAAVLLAGPADAGIGIEVWTDDEGYDGTGRGARVYAADEPARVRFRASSDAYVVLYGIDVDGHVRLIYPTAPRHPHRVAGGVVHEVYADPLHAAGADGVVYVQALACAYPLEPYFPAFFHHAGPRRRPYRPGRADGLVVRFGYVSGDPYLAFAELRRALVPMGCAPHAVGYASLSYSLNAHRPYPRYVCADCHYGGWYDPYGDACSVFEIRIDSFWIDAVPYDASCPPRFYYYKRAHVPHRYRAYKTRWSSKDRGAEMVRYFAGKSPRERDHVRFQTKPQAPRGGRDRSIGDAKRPSKEPEKPGPDRTRARPQRGSRDSEDDERAVKPASPDRAKTAKDKDRRAKESANERRRRPGR